MTERVLSADMIECRVSVLGIIMMIWEGILITVPRTHLGETMQSPSTDR